MFKREDSEWSRFSKSASGQKAATEEIPVKEQAPEPTASAAREVVAPAPPPTPAPSRPSTAPGYTRGHMPAQHDSDEVETIIGPNSFFDGTLRCESSMRIKGGAQGEITCARSVIIEESAQVNAKVTAANATVAGKLDGSIVCDGRLEILATGQVSGELTAGVLIIQEGAFFEGHLKMKERKDDRHSGESSLSKRFGPATSEPVVS